MEIFNFFPQIFIIIGVAFVVIFLAWKFPQSKKKQELQRQTQAVARKQNMSKVSDIKASSADSIVEKDMRIEEQKASRAKRKTRRIKNTASENVAISISKKKKKQPVKSSTDTNVEKVARPKSAQKSTTQNTDAAPTLEDERKKSLEEKREMHQNVLKVIDRVAYLTKRGGGMIKSGAATSAVFVRKQYAALKRRKMTPQQINQEKLLDSLEKAALALGASDYDKAERFYIEVIKFDPRNIRAYKGLAEIYEKQENYDHALASLEYVLKFDPLEKGIEEKMAELRTKRVQKKMADKGKKKKGKK
jgi:tetratricopeptide (TPR) repeat protein